jgi:hypothetical protein
MVITGQILVKYWSNTVVRGEGMPNQQAGTPGQMLVKYLSNTGQTGIYT